MRKNRKSQKARRHAKLLKRLKMKALPEGDLHLSKTGTQRESKSGLHTDYRPSSPERMARLTRIKARPTRKNTNLSISSLRRDVWQFKDVTSSEVREKLNDLEKKVMAHLHAVYNADTRNERIIEDIKKVVVSQDAHAAQQAKEMEALRSDNHTLRMELEKERECRSAVLAKEREDRKAMKNELRRDMDKMAKNHKAAMKETMDNQREKMRRPTGKACRDEEGWDGHLRQGARG
ncbi:hypothetical protein K4K59_012432 [Colletotrichum sp. SAR11_240]|nr:hypothetical protein K4K59_012432 [Colletotrichum sp. SAR11_240]